MYIIMFVYTDASKRSNDDPSAAADATDATKDANAK